MLLKMTEEQRKQSQEAKKQKIEDGLTRFKQDWLDEPYWEELAKKFNVRLPYRHKEITSPMLLKYARMLGLEDGTWEQAFFGEHKSIKQALAYEDSVCKVGGKVGARAYVGMLLEMAGERYGMS